ncbi:MAG: chromosome segregation protein SMC [Nitrospinota bacterium]
MKFKRLEMLGFKSFVDKTVIEFSGDLTAIVGPNGCGKSNVSDAIRWVLGEQGPKNLRAKKMEDVIFNGSADRKPLGMAEVSLTISDLKGVVSSPQFSDYGEIVVTRRLYRSGESEYLINRNPCRLKDVVDLFLDTGVSLDTFSIVEQGRIEGLVNAKPIDRRILIEEAAGIMKYKNRRNEALRKLELAQANLLRVGDVIREKESRLRLLRRQARKATFHKEYQKEIKELELRMSGMDLLRLDGELKPIEREYSAVNERKEVHAGAFSAREADREKCRVDLAERSEALADVRRRAVEVEGYLQRLENRLEMLSGRLVELDGEDERRREEMQSLQKEAHDLEEERGELTALEVSLSEEVEVAKGQYELISDELIGLRSEMAEWEKRENERRELSSREAERLNNTHQRVASAISRRDVIRESIDKLAQELSELETTRGELQNEVEWFTANLTDLSAKVASSRKEAEKIIAEKDKIESSLKEYEELITDSKETLVGIRSSVQALENIEGDSSQDKIGVEKIRGLGVEVRGALADLIKVKSRHEIAIEAALGMNIDGVIVSDPESAAVAIKKLVSSGMAGRGIIHPVNSRGVSSHYIPSAGGIEGRAIDLVEFPNEYRPLMEALLSNIGIVRDLGVAFEAWQKGSEGITWVTLTGEVVYPSGCVEGGSAADPRAGLLERKRRCEEMRIEAAALETRLDDLGERESFYRESLECIQDALDQATQTVRQTELTRVEIEGKLRASQEKLAVSDNRFRALSHQHSQLKIEVNRIDLEHQEAEKEGARTSGMLQEVDARIVDAQKNLKHFGEKLAQMEEQASDRRVLLTVVQGKATGVSAEIQRVIDGIHQNKARVARRREEEEDSVNKRESLHLNIAQSREEIERLKKDKLLIETEQGERSRILEEIRARDEELGELLPNMRDEAAQIQALLTDLAERRTTIRVQREALIESARNEFGIDLIPVAQDYMEFLPEYQEHVNRLDMLRQRLARMGEVNPLAAHEYDEINQEYSFLSEQQEDLENSIQDLHTTIDKLNKTTRKRFTEAFEQVSQKFSEIFGRLFQGGEARMYLLDPNDPLETGVDIEVRPPGKRPGNIMLLSSGEKALTALALLFSVFSVRPSPFCLLDEVDATLDDANVGRFRDVIGEMESRSQFILITHNKRTMSYASRLYGVTQREKGVSIIVSVKMNRPDAEDNGAKENEVATEMEA